MPYIRHNAVCRMPYEICRTGARILSSKPSNGKHFIPIVYRKLKLYFKVKSKTPHDLMHFVFTANCTSLQWFWFFLLLFPNMTFGGTNRECLENDWSVYQIPVIIFTKFSRVNRFYLVYMDIFFIRLTLLRNCHSIYILLLKMLAYKLIKVY